MRTARQSARLILNGISILIVALFGCQSLALAAETPTVSVYTMGPGDGLFERFGHAAICLHYRSSSKDSCYNYGTADFDSPVPLSWGFLRGRAMFWVDVASPAAMIAAYRQADRSVWRQDLPLSATQVAAVIKRLQIDARPENRNYVYRPFDDNCSTKIRDIIDQATGGRLRGGDEQPSFRQLVRPGFAEETLIRMALDLFLSRVADGRTTNWQAMFLPRFLRDSLVKRFGGRPREVYVRKGPAIPRTGQPTWFWWLVLAAALAAPVTVVRWHDPSPAVQRLLLAIPVLVLSLIGLAVWGLWLVSVPDVLRWNEAALVFMPCDLLLLLSADRRQRYAQLRAVLMVATTIFLGVGLLKQPLWMPMFAVFVPMALLAARKAAVENRG